MKIEKFFSNRYYNIKPEQEQHNHNHGTAQKEAYAKALFFNNHPHASKRALVYSTSPTVTSSTRARIDR